MIRRIYLVGSLANTEIPSIGNALRQDGHYVFDDWYSPGNETDKFWQAYEQGRGRTYVEALNGKAAVKNFGFDLENLDDVDTVIMVLPCGKSGHMEFGRSAGAKKSCHIFMPEEPAKWDLMYRFAHGIWMGVDALRTAMRDGSTNITE